MSARVSLEELEIRSPCPVRWEDMRGDERVRYCRHCDLNVYNLSSMARDEAERFVAAHEGRRLCGMMYRRQDGTVITADCEGAWRLRVRRAGRWATAAAAVVLAAAISPFATAVTPDRVADGIRRTWAVVTRPWATLLNGSPTPAPPTGAFAGMVAYPGQISAPTAVLGNVAGPPMLGEIAPVEPATRPTETEDDGRAARAVPDDR